MKKEFQEFLAKKNITPDQYKEKTAAEMSELYTEFIEEKQETINQMVENKASKEDVDKAIDQLKEAMREDLRLTREAVKEIGLTVKAITEDRKPMSQGEKNSLRKMIEDNSEVLQRIKSNKSNGSASINAEAAKFNMEIDTTKGLQGASDIGGRDYFYQTIEAGIERQPVRRTRILDLFRRKPVSTEYLHYWEENVVTRDAKFVVACATSTHTTKKTWIKRTVELAKIRDIVDVCLDMLEDYSFVESEIRELVEESIRLKAESELLLGAAANPTDMLSIDSIASEFNAANPLAPFDESFQAPTIGDLTAAVKAQIYMFGQENKWEADTVLMNYSDMIKYLHAKDSHNNYLFPNFVFGATDMVNGMRIVTSPLVEPNTLFVFDSTKGSILDRKRVTVTASYENKDNIEHELVTFVGVERLQFHVRLINRDAFMKVSDIAAALTAIAIPVTP